MTRNKHKFVTGHRLQGKEANIKLSKAQRQIKIDIQCLPQDLKEIPKGREQRKLLASLGLNSKTAKAISALPPNSPCARQVYHLWTRLRRSKGVKQATKILKELYTELIRYSSGLPILPNTSTWLKRDRDGFPTALSSFKKILREGSTADRRYVLGFVRTFESIKIKPEVNVSTIVEPSKGGDNYKAIANSFKTFAHTSPFGTYIGKRFKQAVDSFVHEGLIFSTKKSPYGGPTCGQLVYQWNLIKNMNLKGLLSDWAYVFNRTDYPSIIKMMDTSKQEDIFKIKDPHQSLGKVSFLRAPGAKTRVVAIVNYWLQDALYPLHKILYTILRSITTDGTFNQSEQAERVRQASEKGPVWSFDLTAATDRLPVEIQVDVLRSLNPTIGRLWEKSLKLLDFRVKELNTVIKYRVGQPMGIYSSWAMLALTHHYIIRYCAWKCGKPNFQAYAVLGDDVAIWDKVVADEYQAMLGILDVKISLLKSFIPEKKGIVVAEFAKRIFRNGVNITPIPSLFQEAAWHNYIHWPTALEWLSQNGFSLDQTALGAIRDLSCLPARDFTDFVCLMHIWNIIHAPLLQEEVLYYLPEGFEYFDKNDVLKERFEVLCIKLNDVSYSDPVYLKSLGWKPEEIERTVQKSSNTIKGLARQPLVAKQEPDYFKLMRLSRFKAFNELKKRFSSLLQTKSAYELYGLTPINPLGNWSKGYNETSPLLQVGQPAEEEFDLFHSVSGLEYLPYPSYENMVDEANSNEEHWKMRNRYIRLISRRLKAKTGS